MLRIDVLSVAKVIKLFWAEILENLVFPNIKNCSKMLQKFFKVFFFFHSVASLWWFNLNYWLIFSKISDSSFESVAAQNCFCEILKFSEFPPGEKFYDIDRRSGENLIFWFNLSVLSVANLFYL